MFLYKIALYVLRPEPVSRSKRRRCMCGRLIYFKFFAGGRGEGGVDILCIWNKKLNCDCITKQAITFILYFLERSLQI